MNKLALTAFIIIVLGALLIWMQYSNGAKLGTTASSGDYKNTTYMIDGQPITLINGVSEVESAPGSASKIITKYFGNDAKGDLNSDDIPDLAFLITQDGGGSGTFFYVVGAVQQADGSYRGTDAVFLGDRIAPQTTEIQNGQVIVNYAIRRDDEPMVAPPSIGKTIRLKLNPQTMQFGEVAQNFEGEADPSRMSLEMKTWVWVSAETSNGQTVTPKKADTFKIRFGTDSRFAATTDCNNVSGDFSADNGTLSFGAMMSTKMFCEGSQESEFTKLLEQTSGYQFTSKGELVLDLKAGSTMTFR